MGGQLYVEFACTYRGDYMPPITMGQNDVIVPGRHLFMILINTAKGGDDSPPGWRYHAEVLEAEIID